MKSTGLFGKNSGRVGGVVYFNYRGQQVVRSYQPQVKNPNTKGQIVQRARFKLVSQLSSVFSKELKMSFYTNDAKMTSRNAWVKRMMKYVTYTSGEASLPIEEIVLTNANGGIQSAVVENRVLDLSLSASEWDRTKVKARVVVVAYTNGGEIRPVQTAYLSPVSGSDNDPIISFTYQVAGLPSNIGNVRMLVYAYEPSADANVIYDDYTVDGEEAVLADIVSELGLSKLHFSETRNLPVSQAV